MYDDAYTLDPTAANDVDIDLRLYRDTTDDYLKFAFEKMFPLNSTATLFDEYLYQVDTEWVINPHETGHKLTITEVNRLDDDRYEG